MIVGKNKNLQCHSTGKTRHLSHFRAVTLNYSNPLWDGYCADPFVLRAGDFYYCYATYAKSQALPDGRHFVLLRSSDLEKWECLGGALLPMEGFQNAQHWAPEVCERDGKFWMYFSCNSPLGNDDTTQRLHVAVADSPEGPFEVVNVEQFPYDFITIDETTFQYTRSRMMFIFYLFGAVHLSL